VVAGCARLGIYFLIGGVIWLCFDVSDIHATIAGVVLGLMTPTRVWVSHAGPGEDRHSGRVCRLCRGWPSDADIVYLRTEDRLTARTHGPPIRATSNAAGRTGSLTVAGYTPSPLRVIARTMTKLATSPNPPVSARTGGAAARTGPRDSPAA
jgi:hypothetical protein